MLFGGTVMCLVFHARPATKDVDAVFEPKDTIYAVAREMAEEYGLPPAWLNDGVKGFLSARGDFEMFLDLPGLRMWAASPEYVFAMKCLAARDDDLQDIRLLMERLGLKDVDSAFDVVERFYPRDRIPPKTRFVLEELFQKDGG